MALPVRRLAAQELHVGPEHRVEEGVGAAERDLHDGGRRDVGVAVLLQPRHQTRQRRADIRRTRRANNLHNCVLLTIDVLCTFHKLFWQLYLYFLTKSWKR